MRITSRVRGGQGISRRFRELQERLSDKKRVYVGLPKGSPKTKDGQSIIEIGAIHEFGGTINHPGGTKYGYRTKKDAEDGKVRFLKDGQGYMVLGETKPHKITIPQRSFLREPLQAKKKEIANLFKRLLPKVARGEITMDQALNQVGSFAVRISQEAINSGIAPANAPSTLARKRSSKPLTDTGHLKNSITYEVRSPGDD